MVGEDGGKEVDGGAICANSSGRHFGILGCRKALQQCYVKRLCRSVIAEMNKVENVNQ